MPAATYTPRTRDNTMDSPLVVFFSIFDCSRCSG